MYILLNVCKQITSVKLLLLQITYVKLLLLHITFNFFFFFAKYQIV